jgi:hypothetical protein
VKSVPRVIALLLLCVGGCLLIGGRATAKQVKSQPQASQPASRTNEGEKRFQENCGRCHNPPQTLSPREARTVLRHMRVRAMLSAEDQRLILQYLAP